MRVGVFIKLVVLFGLAGFTSGCKDQVATDSPPDFECFSESGSGLCDWVELSDGFALGRVTNVIGPECEVYHEGDAPPQCYSGVGCAVRVGFTVENCLAREVCPEEIVIGLEALNSFGLLYSEESNELSWRDSGRRVGSDEAFALGFMELRGSDAFAANPGFFLRFDADGVLQDTNEFCSSPLTKGESAESIWSKAETCEAQSGRQVSGVAYLGKCYQATPDIQPCSNQEECVNDLVCVNSARLCLQRCELDSDCPSNYTCMLEDEGKFCEP